MCTNRKKPPTYKKEINIKTNIVLNEDNSQVSTSSSELSITSLETPDQVDKEDLYIYYESKKMPKSGWMQSCFKCDLFTSKTLIYREEIDKRYIVYVCNNCKKTLTNRSENNKFRERCDKFIINNFEYTDY